MKRELVVQADKREKLGSIEMRRLRGQGILPGVVYDDQGHSQAIQLNTHAFLMMLRGHSSESLLMDMMLEGAKKKVLLREVQHDPVTSKPLHADFIEVSMTKKMRIELPIQLVGDPVGVVQNGGVLEHLARTVVVECLPADVVEMIQVDVSGLGIGDVLTVAALPVDPAKVTILTAKDVAVATVAAPKTEEEAAAEAAPGAAAEPELVGGKKEEGEESAEDKKGAEGKKGGEGKKGE